MVEPFATWEASPAWSRGAYICPTSGCGGYFEWPLRIHRTATVEAQPALIPHPRPEVTMRDAREGETPRTAKALNRAAIEVGLPSRVTYSRGTSIDRRGQPTRVEDCVVVRIGDPRGGAAGIWFDGSFESGWAWGTGVDLHRVGARDLSAWVKGGCRRAAV